MSIKSIVKKLGIVEALFRRCFFCFINTNSILDSKKKEKNRSYIVFILFCYIHRTDKEDLSETSKAIFRIFITNRRIIFFLGCYPLLFVRKSNHSVYFYYNTQ